MKKKIAIIAAVIFFAAFKPVEEEKFVIPKSTVDGMNNYFNLINNAINQSNIPHQDALKLMEITKQAYQEFNNSLDTLKVKK